MRLIISGFVLALLVGCGQKGPLYLPAPEDSSLASVDRQANQTSNTNLATKRQYQIETSSSPFTFSGTLLGKPFSASSS